MGLFDFIKDAGERLLGWEDDQKQAAEAAAKQKEALEARRAADRRVAAKMVDLVQGLGIKVEDLGIRFEDGTATISGRVGSQADREKLILVLGNTQGVGRVDDRLEVAKAEPEAKFYTVQRGDTLSKIAKQHYGDAMEYPVIFEANKPMLTDPDKIYPGQVLRIPPQS